MGERNGHETSILRSYSLYKMNFGIGIYRKCMANPKGINNLHRLVIQHDDIIKWKHFPRYWPFVWGVHRSLVNSQHKGQWRGALVFSLICAWINGWVNNREAGDLRRHRSHYDVIVMKSMLIIFIRLRCHGCCKSSMSIRQEPDYLMISFHVLRMQLWSSIDIFP